MASVAMETRLATAELERAVPIADERQYVPLAPGKVSGLHIPEIEAIAERLAADLSFSPGDDLHNVVKKLGGELGVYDPRLDVSRFSGTFVGEEFGSFQILVPVQTSLPHENVIIAKELGHYFLHHLYSRAKLAGETSDDDAGDPIALSNSEAEVFALCFLMPKTRFLEDLAMAAGDTASLASRYCIPEAVVRRRKQLLEHGNSRG